MIELRVIGTGSTGNCYTLVSPTGSAVVLDVGVPFQKCLPLLKDVGRIEAVCVTHEHKDHCLAVKDWAKRGLKICTTKGTADKLELPNLIQPVIFQPLQCKTFGDFRIIAFPTEHDAAEPCGFLVRYLPTGETLAYATDTYYLRYRFPNVHYWMIECNYIDDIMQEQIASGELEHGMKNRLLTSHMSLNRCMQTLKANDLSYTSKIILVHMSDSRSDELRMTRAIRSMTRIDTIAANNGIKIDLKTCPF